MVSSLIESFQTTSFAQEPNSASSSKSGGFGQENDDFSSGGSDEVQV